MEVRNISNANSKSDVYNGQRRGKNRRLNIYWKIETKILDIHFLEYSRTASGIKNILGIFRSHSRRKGIIIWVGKFLCHSKSS